MCSCTHIYSLQNNIIIYIYIRFKVACECILSAQCLFSTIRNNVYSPWTVGSLWSCDHTSHQYFETGLHYLSALSLMDWCTTPTEVLGQAQHRVSDCWCKTLLPMLEPLLHPRYPTESDTWALNVQKQCQQFHSQTHCSRRETSDTESLTSHQPNVTPETEVFPSVHSRSMEILLNLQAPIMASWLCALMTINTSTLINNIN